MTIFKISLLVFLLTYLLSSRADSGLRPLTDTSITQERLAAIPSAADDIKAERLLLNITKNAKWFPHIKIDVRNGIVLIEGYTNNAEHLAWLTKTAGKLPHVIAVVNRAEVIAPVMTDMTPFYKEWNSLKSQVKKNLPRILIGLALSFGLIVLGLYIQKGVAKLWKREISNPFLLSTVSKLSMIPVWALFFYLTLMTIGMQGLATTIIGGTGVVGIVLGFAFKGIAENYLSGLLLAMRSPFTQGDVIRVDDFEGIVQNLNMRGTTIMDFDGNLILIPNTMVIQSVVKNFTANTMKRTHFVVGIGYCESIKRCQDLIGEILLTIEGVKSEPPPLIIAENFGTSTVNLKIHFWFDSKISSEATLKSFAIIKTKEVLLAHGVSLPDESREVVFTDTLKVQLLEKTLEESADTDRLNAEADLRETQSETDESSEHDEELLRLAARARLPTHSRDGNLLN